MLSRLTNVEIVADPAIEATVTVDVEDMPWDQVLDLITRVNGLSAVVDGGAIRVVRGAHGSGTLLPRRAPVPPPTEPLPVGELDGQQVYRYRRDGPITEPVKIDGAMPEYPEEAKEARIQGVVVLQTVISSNGAVSDIKVLRGLPLGLTEAAIEAVRSWRFEPSLLDGQPVPVMYVFTCKFELADEPESSQP